MSDALSQLKQFSLIVADTGDFESIRAFQPRDATTNPSLLLKAAQMPEYGELVGRVLEESAGLSLPPAGRLRHALEALSVAFGVEILKIVPNRVSTEVDARMSFDTASTVECAKRLISRYEKAGFPRERVLIKIAATWEGIKAAEQLKKDEIRCNLTLLFSFAQAVACADAGVQLISPFVGRILDWYKKSTGRDGYPAAEDPGVLSVTRIYRYYKKFGVATEVMGASFRNTGEILELAGCDLLTISPALLGELAGSTTQVSRKLSVEDANSAAIEKVPMDEKNFRWMHNEDAMATEKLAEGIRLFAADTAKLEAYLTPRL